MSNDKPRPRSIPPYDAPDDDPSLGEDGRIEKMINGRSDIQLLLFALYKFIRSKPAILNDTQYQRAFQLLVGSAFSLWRAIFLIETDRTWLELSESMEKFLYRVVTDNTITYLDDKKSNAWTVGYYIGSAQMRNQRAWNILQHHPGLASDSVEHLSQLVAMELVEWDADATLMEWQISFDALRSLFEIMESSSTDQQSE
jgi:hypothetical protein